MQPSPFHLCASSVRCTPATPTFAAPRGPSQDAYLATAEWYHDDPVFGDSFDPTAAITNVLQQCAGDRPVEIADLQTSEASVPDRKPAVMGLYLLLSIEVTSLFMRRLPRRLWRAVHLSSYGLFVLDGARVDGASLVPDGWLADATSERVGTGRPGRGYGQADTFIIKT